MATIHQRDIIKKNSYESAAWQEQKLVCGIDEVGRGCLAGPVVTAAVILNPNRKSPLLKDSKLMTKQELLEGYAWVTHNGWWALGVVNHRVIDQVNIYQATLQAMKTALIHLISICPAMPSLILVDAMPLNLEDTSYASVDVHHFPRGESISCSIAAASIVAKVKRDELMAKLDHVIPGYQLAQHKGYATQQHRDLIRAHKPSIIHRHSFLQSIITPTEVIHEKQQTFF